MVWATLYKRLLAICLIALWLGSGARGQQTAPSNAPNSNKMTVQVLDENGVAVPGARVTLASGGRMLRCETDFAGRCNLNALRPGSYQMRVEKVGFYRMEASQVRFPETSSLELRINHEQEVRETVDVVESAPAIDPERTASTETLNQREILNVPYPTSRDIRNALPLLPGVVMGPGGNIHVAGSSSTQTLALLDGFDVTEPAPGLMDMRVNSDSIRTIDVDQSRYTAQYGRGDNVLGLNTGIGDDRIRYTLTNFVPSFQNRKGLHFNQWVPRATLSGPIKKGRLWFFEAPEAEYDQMIVPELPDGQDRATSWRTGNLAKIQANLTSTNILTGEFVVNNQHVPHLGLSATTPLPTTINQQGASYMGALKDQQYFKGGTLLEFGFAADDFSLSQLPRGNAPYEIGPDVQRGSYYAATHGSARRFQGIANVFLAPRQWHGRHDFKLGIDANRISYHRRFKRAPVSFLREDGTLARQIVYAGPARSNDLNLQTGMYAQDRWTLRERLLIEAGARVDWDEIIRTPVFGPRLAASWMLDKRGNTKLTAGAGVFYSATNLEVLSRPLSGIRFDTFYAPDGITPLGSPLETRFFVRDDSLREPRTFNWSLGLEQKLPYAVYLKLEFLQKRAANQFVYVNASGSSALTGSYILSNLRSDHYDAATVTVRHTFHNVYPLMVAYTRSSARTNAVMDFSEDALTLGLQQSGRLPWDAPNRVVGWGWMPFIKKIQLGYALEWRTGFPFSAVNGDQTVVGQANDFRFPDYMTLSVAAERRFRLAGYYLALRVTVENATNRRNPTSVINNVTSPGFLTFTGLGHRAFTGRIRFLGRSKGKAPSPVSTNGPIAP